MFASLRRHPALQRLLLIGPAVGMIGFFMIVPLGLMVVVSLLQRNIYGGVQWDSFSTDAYVKFLFERNLDDTLSFTTIYLQIFLRSFWLSLTTTAVALLVGFPVALYMTMQREPYRTVLIFLVTVPFWTNLLVRNYAWVLLLRDTGLINGALLGVGIIDHPLPLLYTPFAVAVGLAYSFMPFMVLPIYASLEKIDFRLVEAAYDLYADRRT
ncbi:MAG: ABC transporter permease, partial [Tistlia sp.]